MSSYIVFMMLVSSTIFDVSYILAPYFLSQQIFDPRITKIQFLMHSIECLVTSEIHTQFLTMIWVLEQINNFSFFKIVKTLKYTKENFHMGLVKETPTQAFSCEICEIFKSTYFQEQLPMTASDKLVLTRQTASILYDLDMILITGT